MYGKAVIAARQYVRGIRGVIGELDVAHIATGALLQNYKVNRDGFKQVFDEDMPENVISWFKRLLAEVTGKLRPPFL